MTSFALGFVGFILFAIISPIGLARVPHRPAMVVHLSAAVLSHLATIFAALILATDTNYWHIAAGFAAPTMAYVFLFGAAQKSLSLNMLVMLGTSADGSLTIDELTRNGIRADFGKRIDILTGSHLAIENNRGYSITDQGRQAANRVEGLRKRLRIELAGLYRQV